PARPYRELSSWLVPASKRSWCVSRELDFPDFPGIHYEFALPAYRLVLWLMQRQDRQLPVSFWRWLLLGELPSSAGGDPQAVQGDSIA
ncbi:MAG: hypothetical protein R6U00_00485, partial [Prochlorococcaceae cyanobacterium]